MSNHSAVLHSFMKKRQTPKNQLCPKHGTKMASVVQASTRNHNIRKANVPPMTVKVCQECEREEREKGP